MKYEKFLQTELNSVNLKFMNDSFNDDTSKVEKIKSNKKLFNIIKVILIILFFVGWSCVVWYFYDNQNLTLVFEMSPILIGLFHYCSVKFDIHILKLKLTANKINKHVVFFKYLFDLLFYLSVLTFTVLLVLSF